MRESGGAYGERDTNIKRGETIWIEERFLLQNDGRRKFSIIGQTFYTTPSFTVTQHRDFWRRMLKPTLTWLFFHHSCCKGHFPLPSSGNHGSFCNLANFLLRNNLSHCWVRSEGGITQGVSQMSTDDSTANRASLCAELQTVTLCLKIIPLFILGLTLYICKKKKKKM